MKERTPSREKTRLTGTWKLKSYSVIEETGKISFPYGEEPIGFLNYTADGRMQVIGTRKKRGSNALRSESPQDPMRHDRQMFAYAGAYSVEPGKVIHHVEVAWDESWIGTDQVRCYKLHGNALTFTSQAENPIDGIAIRYVVKWEKLGSRLS